MTLEKYITNLPIGLKIINHQQSRHIKDEYTPKKTYLMCDLYNMESPARHCLDMKCNGHFVWFCYTEPKDGKL